MVVAAGGGGGGGLWVVLVLVVLILAFLLIPSSVLDRSGCAALHQLRSKCFAVIEFKRKNTSKIHASPAGKVIRTPLPQPTLPKPPPKPKMPTLPKPPPKSPAARRDLVRPPQLRRPVDALTDVGALRTEDAGGHPRVRVGAFRARHHCRPIL